MIFFVAIDGFVTSFLSNSYKLTAGADLRVNAFQSGQT